MEANGVALNGSNQMPVARVPGRRVPRSILGTFEAWQTAGLNALTTDGYGRQTIEQALNGSNNKCLFLAHVWSRLKGAAKHFRHV